jgi:hypothetical protein
VIAGHKLNDEPLGRAEADRLAHEPVKPAATDLGRGANAPKSGANAPPKQAPKQLQPAPAVDLRTTRADQAGGSAGFRSPLPPEPKGLLARQLPPLRPDYYDAI